MTVKPVKDGSWNWGESAHISRGKNTKKRRLVLTGYRRITDSLIIAKKHLITTFIDLLLLAGKLLQSLQVL